MSPSVKNTTMNGTQKADNNLSIKLTFHLSTIK